MWGKHFGQPIHKNERLDDRGIGFFYEYESNDKVRDYFIIKESFTYHVSKEGRGITCLELVLLYSIQCRKRFTEGKLGGGIEWPKVGLRDTLLI